MMHTFTDLNYTMIMCISVGKMPLTTILTTSKNVLFPGHNHLATMATDTEYSSLAGARVIIKVPVINMVVIIWKEDILEVASMVDTWWIMFFCAVQMHNNGRVMPLRTLNINSET